ncbi:hypothetical protein KEM54_006330 [Ascosphaera aggregata]|nr:hypothetical protein KEM54_006330 [Ascosphaera aggregata]
MLAGSHRCLGSNVSSSSLETAAAAAAANLSLTLPAEPLLFLYPRWSTPSSALKAERLHRLARPVRRWPSLGALIKHRMPPPPDSAQLHDFYTLRCYSSSIFAAQEQVLSDSRTIKEDSQLAYGSTSSLTLGVTPASNPLNASTEMCNAQRPHHDSTTCSSREVNCSDPFEFDIANNLRSHHDFEIDFLAMSNIDPPRTVHSTPRSDSAVRARKTADQQHWQEILDTLLDLTKPTVNTEDPDAIEEVLIPETTVVKILGDVGENKFYMNNLNGCMVHVLPRTNDYNGTHRKIVLHGSPVSRRLTLQMLQDAVAETPLKGELPSSSSSPSSSSQSLKISFAWDTSRNPKLRQQRADALPHPRVWNLKSFNHFVSDLASIPMTHGAHRTLYKYGERHTHVVRNILYHLFDDPATASLISTHALNVLIAYFDKNGALPQFWMLYPRVEPLMTTRTFNTLLKHAALKGDLRLFHDIINKMRKAGTKPNGLTWVCFLKASRLKAARTSIMRTMYQLGLLENDHFLQSAVPTIISRDFYFCTRLGMTAFEFIEYVNSKLGIRWFSKMAAREMIYVSIIFRNSASIISVLEHCDRSGVTPDSWTLSQVLRHFSAMQDFVGGMTFFFHAYRRFKMRAGYETLDYLFSLAWNCQALNTCRIIWWYACLQNRATWSMRSKVLQSLENNAHSNNGDQSRYWYASAGKLIAGIETRALIRILNKESNASFRTFMEADKPRGYFKKYPLRIIDQLGVYLPKGSLRLQQCNIARCIVKSDLGASLRWQTKAPFIKMLVDAANMDARSDDLSSDDGSAENMIRIPLSKKMMQRRRYRHGIRKAKNNSNSSELRKT